jgi:hypothetical protein
MACFGGASVAQAACDVQPTSQPFALFGDSSRYSLAPGGDFEAGAPPWTLNGAAVTPGNETFFASGASDRQSLTIAPSGVAVSPPFCVDPTKPYVRLFARKLSGGVGAVRVDILYSSPINRHEMAATAGYVIQGYRNANGDYTDWAPSPMLKLAGALRLWKTDTGVLPVRLRLTANSAAGSWAVDDVEIDPYRF